MDAYGPDIRKNSFITLLLWCSTETWQLRYMLLTVKCCRNGKCLATKHDQVLFGYQMCWCCTEWPNSIKHVWMNKMFYNVWSKVWRHSNFIKHDPTQQKLNMKKKLKLPQHNRIQIYQIRRVRTKSWILEKVWKFANYFSRPGKSMEIKGKVLKNGMKSGIFLKEQQVLKS